MGTVNGRKCKGNKFNYNEVFFEEVALNLKDEKKPHKSGKVYSREEVNKNKGPELEEY